MKGIEYFQKYGDRLRGEEVDISGYDITSDKGRTEAIEAIDRSINKALSEMMIEMIEEVQSTFKSRGCKRDESVASVIREMNGRYNVVVKKLEEAGTPSIKRDAFAKFWIGRIPELKEYIHIKEEEDIS